MPFTPPGFIVGKERSGTTMFSAMLNRHPDLCVTPETDFMYMLSSYPGGSEGFKKDWPDSAHKILGRIHPTEEWTALDSLVIEAVDGHPTSGRDTFLLLGKLISKRYQKTLWLEKTPNHILCLPFIRETFPDAPVIHIVRDGRDVANSLTKVRFGSPSFYKNLLDWKHAVDCAENFFSADGNAFLVKYEDLLTETKFTLEKVCSFLGVPFDERMLIPDGSEKALIDKTGSHMDQAGAPLDHSKLRGWFANLSLQRQKGAELIAGTQLRHFQYESIVPAGTATQPVFISLSFLESNNQTDIREKVLDAIANGPTTYRTTKFGELANLDSSRYSLIITNEVPVPANELGKFSNVLFFGRILFILLSRKLRGSKIVWIYSPNEKNATRWPLRRWVANVLALTSTAIVCDGCFEDIDRSSRVARLARKTKTVYTAIEDFEARLLRLLYGKGA
jgi:hypothetical protein